MRTVVRLLPHSTRKRHIEWRPRWEYASGCSCPNDKVLFPSRAEDFIMDHRLCAVLVIICLALEGTGCASKAHRHRRVPKHTQVVLLPRQTGSNLDRRITVDDESSFKSMPEPESTPSSKKHVKTKRTEPEKPKHAEPEKPKDTSTEPDRFR
jgi:hypothetical protein